MGDVLLKHALLQRLVLVSASPSNGERSPLGTLCKFWEASAQKKLDSVGGVPLTTGSHSFKARAFVVVRRVSSSLRERVSIGNKLYRGNSVSLCTITKLSSKLLLTLTPRRSFRQR